MAPTHGNSDEIDALLHETRRFPPPEWWTRHANVRTAGIYDRAAADPEAFWAERARELEWITPFSKTLDGGFPSPKWFADGTLNVSANCLDRHVRNGRGDRTVFIWEGEPGDTRAITYRELLDDVSRFASVLRAKGVRKGDRVALYMPLIPELAIAMLACARIGAIHSVVFGGFSADALRDRINDSECVALVTADGGYRRGNIVPLKQMADAALEGTPSITTVIVVRRGGGRDIPSPMQPGRDHWYHELMASESGAADPEPMGAEDMLYILYTSGTTGKPKGAELTHRALVGRFGSGALVPERLLARGAVSGMPVAHIAGFAMLVQLLSLGVPVHLLAKFRPTDALDAIERERPMMFIGVPAMYQMMLDAGAADRDLSSVRVWSSGADALRPEVAEAFQRFGSTFRLPLLGRGVGRATFVDGYGMVELGGGVALRVHPPIPLPLSGLRPMGGARLAVLDDEGREVPRGEVGELAVKGPGVMRGYHGNAEATREAMTDDGWLRTGDLARARPLGFFELAGRKKDVIKHGGYSVFAVEVEHALAEHPAVAEVAVLGLPDQRKGEVPVAVVRLAPGAVATVDDLRAFAATRLADYKRPTRVVLVDHLPRTGTEKVQKQALRRLFDDG